MGYFAYGWAKKYRFGKGKPEREKVKGEENEDAVVWLTGDRAGRLILVVRRRSICLWSAGRHRVVTGWDDFSGLLGDDELHGGCFDWTGRKIMLVSRQGKFYEVQITSKRADRSLLDLNSSEEIEDFVELVPYLSLHVKLSLDLGLVMTSLVATKAGVFLGTERGDLMLVSYDCVVCHRVHLQKALTAEGAFKQIGAYQHREDPEKALQNGKKVTCLDYCAARDLLGVVTEGGVALLFHVPRTEEPNPTRGWWLRSEKASSVALETQRGTVAVGLTNGDIELLLVGYSPGERCQMLRRLTLTSWYFVPEEIGRVNYMRWSADGVALAVGWEKQGMVVWSVTGCKLIWSLPQVGSAVASTPQSSSRSARGFDELASGVKSLLWGQEGLSLVAVPNSSRRIQFVEYHLFKSASLANPFQSEATRLAMVGRDRLLMLGLHEESDDEIFEWQQIFYPKDYMEANWPPRLVAVSFDLNYLALAGRKGFGIYQLRARRWRLFGDVRQEESMRCCALAWVGKLICACCELKNGKIELRLYARDHLDESGIKARLSLPNKVECLDVQLDGHILLLCTNGALFILKAETKLVGKTETTTLTRVRVLSLQESLAKEISTVRLYPPMAQMSSDNESKSSPKDLLLLKRTGNLQLLDLSSMVSYPLMRNVEHVWYTSSTEIPFDSKEFRPSIWAYSENGLCVSFGSKQSNDWKDFTAERWFDWDPEVFPLGATAVHGMVLGATQGLVFQTVPKENPLSCPYHIVKVKRQPVLHRLLRHVLTSNDNNKVPLKLALQCVNLPQFGDSLEWLLYETVLEHDRSGMLKSNGSPAESDSLFARVVWLLKHFGEYEDIVVRCARKMDSHWWPLLFHYAGEPAALLETCSTMSRLRTAACLLVILQEMFGYASSTPHALRLLEAALKTEQLVLAADLLNFLRKAQVANMLNLTTTEVGTVEKDMLENIAALYGGEGVVPPLPVIVIPVMKKATSLLEQVKLRPLGALARAMDFSLPAWLERNRDANNSKLSPLKKLITLHDQFQWPLPMTELVDRKLASFERVRSGRLSGGAVEKVSASSRALRGGLGKYDDKGRREIIFLQKAFLKARIYDLALLLSAMLLDIEATVALLLSNPSLESDFVDSLGSYSPGYRQLVTELQQLVMEGKAES